MLHQITSIASEISVLSLNIQLGKWQRRVLVGTQYSRPILSENLHVAIMHHCSWYTTTIQIRSDVKITPVGWAVLMTSYTRQKHYNWYQYGWNCQPAPLFASSTSVYRVLTPSTRTCKWWQNSTCGLYSIWDRYCAGRRNAMGKNYSYAILGRSPHYIDHFQSWADRNVPRWETVYSHISNRKPRLAIPADILRMVKPVETWTNTCSALAFKGQ